MATLPNYAMNLHCGTKITIKHDMFMIHVHIFSGCHPLQLQIQLILPNQTGGGNVRHLSPLVFLGCQSTRCAVQKQYCVISFSYHFLFCFIPTIFFQQCSSFLIVSDLFSPLLYPSRLFAACPNPSSDLSSSQRTSNFSGSSHVFSPFTFSRFLSVPLRNPQLNCF